MTVEQLREVLGQFDPKAQIRIARVVNGRIELAEHVSGAGVLEDGAKSIALIWVGGKSV